MKNPAQWKWFAWGKHPAVPDFVCAGNQTPLFQRFSQWVDKGFAKVDIALKSRSRHCSWRFWTRGTHDDVVCGLVRNSCDNCGRSFPLLCLGSGGLNNWSENCTFLPLAFESVWNRFEDMSTARYTSISRLNEALQLIEPPVPAWREFQRHLFKSVPGGTQSAFETHHCGKNRLFTIACQSSELLALDRNFANMLTPAEGGTCPLAVFIGEIGDRIGIGVIEEILQPMDFAWLWSDHLTRSDAEKKK